MQEFVGGEEYGILCHAARMQSVPAAGERVPLVEIGSHSRGSVFLDAVRDAYTPELEAAVDRATRIPAFASAVSTCARLHQPRCGVESSPFLS